MSDYTEMTLAELFAVADAIGDKYLSDEEIIQRDAQLEDVLIELAEAIVVDPT